MVCDDWIKLADPTAPTITSPPADLATTTRGRPQLALMRPKEGLIRYFFAAAASDSSHQYTRACCARSANYDPSKKSTHSSHETAPIRSLMI